MRCQNLLHTQYFYVYDQMSVRSLQFLFGEESTVAKSVINVVLWALNAPKQQP